MISNKSQPFFDLTTSQRSSQNQKTWQQGQHQNNEQQKPVEEEKKENIESKIEQNEVKIEEEVPKTEIKPKKEKKSFIEMFPWFVYYRTSWFILLAFLTFFLSNRRFRSNSPVIIDPNREAVDCNNIKLLSVTTEDNKVFVILEAEEFIEYPRIVAPSLIHVKIETPISTATYTSRQFWDLEENYPNISFCILQTVSGHAKTSVYCQKHLLDEFEVDVPAVRVFPLGWSRIVSSKDSPAILNDFCVDENEDIVYLSPPEMELRPIQVGESDFISMVTNHTSLQYFLSEYKNYELIDEPVVFAASSSSDKWILLFDYLLPIWYNAYMGIDDQPVKIRTLRFDEEMKETFARIAGDKLLPNKPQCYKSGRFLNNQGSHAYNQPYIDSDMRDDMIAKYEQVMKYPGDVFRTFRDRYSKSKFVPKRIILDKHFMNQFNDTITELFPDAEILPLQLEQPMYKIADDIHSANIFMASHLTTVSLGIFLSDYATLIEARPMDAECYTFGGDIVNHTGANYIPIGIKELCACNNLKEYFSLPCLYQQLTPQMLKSAIESAFEWASQK